LPGFGVKELFESIKCRRFDGPQKAGTGSKYKPTGIAKRVFA
jgi:hypothetical protein